MEDYRELVEENIDYDTLLENYPYDDERITEIVSIMAEVLAGNANKGYSVNWEQLSCEIVRSIFMQINNEHIRYVL